MVERLDIQLNQLNQQLIGQSVGLGHPIARMGLRWCECRCPLSAPHARESPPKHFREGPEFLEYNLIYANILAFFLYLIPSVDKANHALNILYECFLIKW